MDDYAFRVWNKVSKTMNYTGFLINSIGEILDLGTKKELKPDSYFLMQQIGLRDRNQQCIFEKDILLANNNGNTEIIKVWHCAPEWLGKDLLNGAGSFDIAAWGNGEEVQEFLILGNEFENPEFLDTKYAKKYLKKFHGGGTK